MTFAPDGAHVATASGDGTARIFDVATDAPRHRLEHGGEVWQVVYSRDGTRVATASYDRHARVFDAATGTELARLTHDGEVIAIAFAPDGWLATASADRSLRIWRTKETA